MGKVTLPGTGECCPQILESHFEKGPGTGNAKKNIKKKKKKKRPVLPVVPKGLQIQPRVRSVNKFKRALRATAHPLW